LAPADAAQLSHHPWHIPPRADTRVRHPQRSAGAVLSPIMVRETNEKPDRRREFSGSQ